MHKLTKNSIFATASHVRTLELLAACSIYIHTAIGGRINRCGLFQLYTAYVVKILPLNNKKP